RRSGAPASAPGGCAPAPAWGAPWAPKPWWRGPAAAPRTARTPGRRHDDQHALREGHIDVGSYLAFVGLDRGAAARCLGKQDIAPNGLSVWPLAMRISSRSRAGGINAEPIMPRPPALETAATRRP